MASGVECVEFGAIAATPKRRHTTRIDSDAGRHGRVFSSNHSWSLGLYIAFMIYFIFYLCVRIWISLIVTKLYSLLMKIGEQKAKELDDHNSYVAKCACAP